VNQTQTSHTEAELVAAQADRIRLLEPSRV